MGHRGRMKAAWCHQFPLTDPCSPANVNTEWWCWLALRITVLSPSNPAGSVRGLSACSAATGNASQTPAKNQHRQLSCKSVWRWAIASIYKINTSTELLSALPGLCSGCVCCEGGRGCLSYVCFWYSFSGTLANMQNSMLFWWRLRKKSTMF